MASKLWREHESVFADEYQCSTDDNWHDYYYLSPRQPDVCALEYHLHRAGVEVEAPPLFVVGRTTPPAYSVISCVTKGEGFLTYNGDTFLLKAGQVFLLPANVPHRYSNNPAHPFGLVWIEFYGGDSQRLLRHVVDAYGPVLEGALFHKISASLSTMMQKVSVQPNACVAVDIYAVLHQLLHHRGDGQTQEDVMQTAMERVVPYIDAHLDTRMSNEELAQVCHMSKSHFCRLFKVTYHTTPQAYILNKKLQIAKHYLIYRRISCEKISELLGFSDAAHFTKLFNAQEHMTPNAYRKAMKPFKI